MNIGRTFLRKKSLLVPLGIMLFLGFIVSIWTVTSAYMTLSRESALQGLKEQVGAASEQIQSYFRSLRSDLFRIERYLAHTNMKVDEELHRYLKFVMGSRPDAIPAILVLDAGGNVLVSTNPALSKSNFRECEYFKRVQQTAHRVYLSGAFTLADSDRCSEILSKAFSDNLDMGFAIHTGVYSKGVFQGAVFFIVKAEPFFGRYSRAITTLSSGHGFVLQEDGRILYHREVELRGKFLSDLSEYPELVKANYLTKNLERKTLEHCVIGQHIMVTAGMDLANQRWMLGISTTTSSLTQKALTFIYTLSGLVIVLGIIIFALIFALIRLGQAEEALAAEKERLAVTLRSIGDGVIATDTEGKILLINQIAERLTGWSQREAVDKPFNEVFHIINEKTLERCESPFEKVLETGRISNLADQTILISKDGNERIIADSAAPIRDKEGKMIGMVLVFRDITEKRKMEEDLLKTTKLESIGFLAGGIAHDFNNILTGILGNIALAKMYLEPEDKLRETLADAEEACLQAKSLTQQLLTFSKGGAPLVRTVSIVKLLKDSTRFALRGANVRCELSIPDDLWPVDVDEGQVSQVINNLVINAQQSMPEGGTVTVLAENTTSGKERATHGLPLTDEKYVKMSIIDSGAGIPEKYLQKIFDPYFTTKETGSGLGLATSYSIIKKHKGHMTVESEIGAGTIFSIYLPASQEKIVTSKDEKEQPPGGKGKILVMDDEKLLRDLAGQLLTHLGYDVEIAGDGAEAIQKYKNAKESEVSFDVVIMDLTVPGGMGGKEAIQKLIEIDPEVKAIVSSGYSNDPVMANFRKYGFTGVVSKPYEIKELVNAVNSIITSTPL